MIPEFQIHARSVGRDEPALVVAEIAQAHDGSLGFAHAFIDAAAYAGADAVKFQTHLAEAESTPAEPWRIQFSPQDETRFDYWRRMEFSGEHWAGLHEHCRNRELLFLSSPFSVEAVELLTRTGIDAWKLASGQHGDTPTFEALCATRLPAIVSTGMSDWSEIDSTVNRLGEMDVPCAVLQCTSAYPTPPNQLGLNVITQLRNRYNIPVGLSDHSATIYAAIAAAALNIDLLEIHVTFDRRMYGPDTVASVTFDELRVLIEGVRFVEAANANPVDKDAMAEELREMRRIFGKSIVAARDLPAGCEITASDLSLKKPGAGLSYEHWDKLLGRRIRRNLSANELLSLYDVE